MLMLRPTESATVFLQQLGRGLRWAEGKPVLTVLDLVGQVRREYRYDVRYRALLGGTRHQVQRAVEADFPLLPPGCALKLDRIAKETVLRNLRDAVRNARARLADDLRTLGPEARLGEFMHEAGAELEDIYPISPTLFHWESQNNASADTPTGRRYVEQPARGTNVILFVRERKRDGRGVALPYCCPGRAHYRSHESERPMKVLWELERPMPGWLYQAGKVVAG